MKPKLSMENAPLENKILFVHVPEIPIGISEGADLEMALAQLKKEADETDRSVTMVQIYVTSRQSESFSGVIITIMAQWIGRATLEKMTRLQQLQQGAQVPGQTPLRGVH